LPEATQTAQGVDGIAQVKFTAEDVIRPSWWRGSSRLTRIAAKPATKKS